MRFLVGTWMMSDISLMTDDRPLKGFYRGMLDDTGLVVKFLSFHPHGETLHFRG